MTVGPKQPVRKKLIEVSIPLEAINAASAREKSIRHGHPSTLHLWWARRPLAACRAVLFAQLVDDPSSWPERFGNDETKIESERKRLHKIIADMVPWEALNNETILNAARWEIARSVAWGLNEEPPPKADTKAILNYLQTKGPPVYDPFSGGGSIPLEAQRLGLRSYGSDLNPVAVLIGKALVEIPPKFADLPPVNPKSREEAKNGELRSWRGAQGLAEDVRHYGQWIRDEAQRRIGHFYPKAKLSDGSEVTVIAWLWARTVRSPDPAANGAMVPLVSSFMLSNKEGRKAWIEPIIDRGALDGYRFDVKSGAISKKDEEQRKKGTKEGRGSFTCILSGAAINLDHIRSEANSTGLGRRLIAIVVENANRQGFVSPTIEQQVIADSAHADWSPDLVVTNPCHDVDRLPMYGMKTWGDAFSDRQKMTLDTVSSLIPEVISRVLTDCKSAGIDLARAETVAKAIATYMGLAVGRSANYWSNFTPWADNFILQTFGRQTIQMVWDYAEANPFSESTGNLQGAVDWIANAISQSAPASGFGSILQADARTVQIGVDSLISTDPPYYDNIQYSEISDYFYVWLRKALSSVWPDLFRRLSTPKDEELVAAPHRHGGRQNAEKAFMLGMAKVITHLRKSSSQQYPLAIYYAYKQAEAAEGGTTSAGWASFLQAVVNGGLAIDGTWPIRTERSQGLKSNSNALASSVVLVCRQRPSEAAVITRSDFVRLLKRELPDAIDAIRKAGVGPVDMQQSVIGPGMGVFSRYAKVLEDDDSSMPVKTALSLINRVWEEIENELDTAFDPETQVALAWFATYGFDARASGELITLANAKNIASKTLFETGVFKDLKGKAALTPRDELPYDWTPATEKSLTVWECVQHTARVLNAEDGGGAAAGRLVAEMGPKASEARALAYRLFEIATQKGWAAEALIYNELAQEWPRLEDLASTADVRASTAAAQADLF